MNIKRFIVIACHIILSLGIAPGVCSHILAKSNPAVMRFYSQNDLNPANTLRANLTQNSESNGVFSYFSWLPSQVKISSTGTPVSSVLDENRTNSSTGPISIDGDALFFPNPFRQAEGAELGFNLLNAGALEGPISLIIYDMRGNVIHRGEANKNTPGASEGYNRVATQGSIKNGSSNYLGTIAFGLDQMRKLPSAVYFFVLMYNDEILEKGKFAVIP